MRNIRRAAEQIVGSEVDAGYDPYGFSLNGLKPSVFAADGSKPERGQRASKGWGAVKRLNRKT